jgi:hypothetical protein
VELKTGRKGKPRLLRRGILAQLVQRDAKRVGELYGVGYQTVAAFFNFLNGAARHAGQSDQRGDAKPPRKPKLPKPHLLSSFLQNEGQDGVDKEQRDEDSVEPRWILQVDYFKNDRQQKKNRKSFV